MTATHMIASGGARLDEQTNVRGQGVSSSVAEDGKPAIYLIVVPRLRSIAYTAYGTFMACKS
jgi:hypothetical protein